MNPLTTSSSATPGDDEHAPVNPATSPDTEPDTDAPPTEPSPSADAPSDGDE